MIVRVPVNKIPKLWDAIKYAATNADRVNEKDLPLYLNDLLFALLNGKAQCFIRMGEDSQLLALMITRIVQDNITGKKELFLNCFYSFQRVSDEELKSDLEVVSDFARKNSCSAIVTYSNSSRVFEIVGLLKFEEYYRCFKLNLSER